MTRILVSGDRDRWSLASSYRRAFEKLGHAASSFDYYGTKALPELGGRLGGILRAPVDRRWAALRLLSVVRAQRPHLVFFTKCDDLPAWTYHALEGMGVRTAAFHPDDPFRVKRFWQKGPSHRRAVAQMRGVDHFFVWADHLVERARACGARRASYLGFGVDPDFAHPLEVDAMQRREVASDVSFVGNWDERREEWLAALAGRVSLSIWGSEYWRDRCRTESLRSAWRGGTAEAEAFCRVTCSSRLNVNVLREQNDGGENMRTYEIPACGGVMISNHSVGQERVFRDGLEAFYARTPRELADLAVKLLQMPELLERVGKAALLRSEQNHYSNRASSVLEAVVG